ncbi:COREPRESSOR [Salix purpurea]|uniref:COREPRESSOR n=1 Tax=Salix purpurea TaxID=77065 RepID=A0A9Q0UQ97_SALPP|nr:COREPRESSOR [Salix purpurea]
MGKNQAYKAMQRSRLGTSSSGPEEIEDGMVDGSFHSPEWHAARLASLNKSHTVTWEEFKKKQKEDEMRKGELEADKDRMMREYRAQLDAERAHKLAHGRNHSGSNSIHKKDRKDRDLKKRGKVFSVGSYTPSYVLQMKTQLLMENTLCDSEAIERNTEMDHPLRLIRWFIFQHLRRRSDDSSSSSSSSDSSSSEDERELKRSKSRSRKTKKEKKRKSRTKHSSGDDEEAGGPVPLSRFFGSLKN